MGKVTIDISYLEQQLLPLGYRLDMSQEKPLFWKKIRHEDLKSPYAFSLVMVVIDEYTIRIEGLNEPRLRRAIRQGVIEINSPEEVEALKEVVFESTLDQQARLEIVLPFFEQQLQALEQHALGSDAYKKALNNIALLVEAANELE